MKLRTLLTALALLLTASLSWAGGPEMLLMVTGRHDSIPAVTEGDAVNGYTSGSCRGISDTGTNIIIPNGTGNFTADARCSGGTGTVTIELIWGVTVRDSVTCGPGEDKTEALTFPVTASSSNKFQVRATNIGAAWYLADNFQIPDP